MYCLTVAALIGSPSGFVSRRAIEAWSMPWNQYCSDWRSRSDSLTACSMPPAMEGVTNGRSWATATTVSMNWPRSVLLSRNAEAPAFSTVATIIGSTCTEKTTTRSPSSHRPATRSVTSLPPASLSPSSRSSTTTSASRPGPAKAASIELPAETMTVRLRGSDAIQARTPSTTTSRSSTRAMRTTRSTMLVPTAGPLPAPSRSEPNRSPP